MNIVQNSRKKLVDSYRHVADSRWKLLWQPEWENTSRYGLHPGTSSQVLGKYWSVSAAAGYTLQFKADQCDIITDIDATKKQNLDIKDTIKTFNYCSFSTVTSMTQHLSPLTWVSKFSFQWHLSVSLRTSSMTLVCISLFAAQLWRAADAENPALWLAERLCSIRPPDGLKQLFKWRVYIYKEKDVYSPFNISMDTGSKRMTSLTLCYFLCSGSGALTNNQSSVLF